MTHDLIFVTDRVVQALHVVLVVQEVRVSLFQEHPVDQPVQEVQGPQCRLFGKNKRHFLSNSSVFFLFF